MIDCISNIAWRKDDNKEILPVLRDIGIKSIEVAPLEIFESWESVSFQQIKNFKNTCDNYSLQIVSMQSIFYKKNINIFQDYEKSVEHMKLIFSILEDLECDYCVFGAPKSRITSLPVQESYKIFKNFLYESPSSITIGIESNPEQYGTNFINNYRQNTDFIETHIDRDNIKIHLDIGCHLMSKVNSDLVFEKAIKHSSNHVHYSKPMLGIIDNITKDESRLLNMVSDKTISLEMKKTNIDVLKKIITNNLNKTIN